MGNGGKKIRLSFNSPVILGFTLACFIVLILDKVTGSASTRTFFSVYRSSLASPFTYIRFFGHVFGHASWDHFFGNIMMLLVVGPLLEEKYGSANILFVILTTALVTGVINFILFPHVQLLGASGVVFAFILLASFTSIEDGKIPLTFILIAILYIGNEIITGVFTSDNISQFAHIIGGVCGCIFGWGIDPERKKS